MASANRRIRLEAAGGGPGGKQEARLLGPWFDPAAPSPTPRRLLSEKRAGDGEDLGLGVGGGEGRAPGLSLPGAAWSAGRSAGRRGASAGEKGLSRTRARAVPGPWPYRFLLSSRATAQPSASGRGASSPAPHPPRDPGSGASAPSVPRSYPAGRAPSRTFCSSSCRCSA